MSAVAAGFTELVPRPNRGRVFKQTQRPSLGDCAPSGRLRLDAVARWLQDIAYFDVEDAGLAASAVWVVRRSRICVSRFPRFGEPHVLETFCSGMGRMWAERRTSIVGIDGASGQVEAVSLWVHLDPDSKRPIPFNEREIATYGEAADGRRVTARLRQRLPAGLGVDGASARAATRRTWHFRTTECDVAGHINNAAYWQPLEEELLSGDEIESIDAEIEFRTPAQPGEKLVVADGDRRWVVDPGGETHASITVAGGVLRI